MTGLASIRRLKETTTGLTVPKAKAKTKMLSLAGQGTTQTTELQFIMEWVNLLSGASGHKPMSKAGVYKFG